MEKIKTYKILAVSCLLLNILIWIPNTVFAISSPFWMLSFFIAPIGIVFSALIKNYLLVTLNAIMFFSFFLLMGIGYIINSFS
ncbi:hypothetical protein [Paraliobacillus sp. JSM ZJ581]|uniref:hypothetical protein n=1 Tax=Paraliobacillus sp. JSM ZJ581 TaxID=3342118 RepID=UPI0035A87DAE